MVQEIVQNSNASTFTTMGSPGKPITFPSIWYVDSSASHHITNSSANLQNIKHVSGNHHIHTADGGVISQFSPLLTSYITYIERKKKSPKLTANLLSISGLVDDKY